MNREQLKELGLTDEQIDAVMKEHGKTINATKQQLDSAETEREDLKKQLADRDAQLETLKKDAGSSEKLKQQIEQLQADNKAAKEKYEAETKALRLDTALKLQLGGKVHDPDIVLGLLDKDKIELDDDGNIKAGFDDQLKSLQESKGFLFVSEKENPTFKGFKPFEGSGGEQGSGTTSLGASFAKQANQQPESNSKTIWD